jgi:hypothetical protein
MCQLAVTDSGGSVRYAAKLVAGDTNGLPDIFIRDLLTGKTTRDVFIRDLR